MSRLYNTFEFIGNIHIPRNKDKFHKVENFDNSGWEKHTLNFAVKESNTNSAFVELAGGFSHKKQNWVYSFGKGTENVSGTKLEIPWADRMKPETLDMVADFKKTVVDFTTDSEVKEKASKLRYEIRTLEYKDTLTADELSKLNDLTKQHNELTPDRYEFVHEYDAVLFLANKLESYKEHKFRITGSIEYSEWKGKFYRKFKPEAFEIVDNETPSQLRALMDIFFTKESLDDKDFNKDKKIYINGYVLSYDNKVKHDMFFPQQFIINAAKIDVNNEAHVNRLNFLKNQFSVKGKGVFHLQWTVNIFRGADKVEFTEKDLTDKQKEAIAFGYAKLEDYAPKGGMLGESVEENRLVKPILAQVNDMNDFRDGAMESTYNADDLVYVAPQQQEKKQETKEKPITQKDVDLELDNLFG